MTDRDALIARLRELGSKDGCYSPVYENCIEAAILPASPQAQKTPHPLDWCDGSGAQCDGCPACKPPQAEMMPTEGGQ